MSARPLVNIAAIATAAAACAPIEGARAAERYEIDPTHTHIIFSVNRFGYNDVIAFLPGVSGVITLDEDSPEKSAVVVEIDVASLESFDQARDDAVRSEFWFNAGKYPVMTFQSTAVTLTGENQAQVIGDMTILGQTRPVTLDVKLNKLDVDRVENLKAAGFSARTTLKRSDFGMETAPGLVGDEVSVRIETLAHIVEE